MAKLVTNQSWDDFSQDMPRPKKVRYEASPAKLGCLQPGKFTRWPWDAEQRIWNAGIYSVIYAIKFLYAGMYSIQYHSISRKHGISVLSRSDYCIDCIRHVYRIWNSPQNISTRDGNESLRFQSKPEHPSEIGRCRRKRNAIGIGKNLTINNNHHIS